MWGVYSILLGDMPDLAYLLLIPGVKVSGTSSDAKEPITSV
jgi:hypothetical protein